MVTLEKSLLDKLLSPIIFIVLGDLIKSQCETIFNPYCDPNKLSEGSQLSYNCEYKIGEDNLGLKGGYPYTKTFSLESQVYSDYISCECDK
jgi:hypothetical protein